MGEIDFLAVKCKTTTDEKTFGVCDNDSKPWAYIQSGNEVDWIVKVQNEKGGEVDFIAVDKCLDIRDKKREKISTCDAMLLKGESIVFIELKDRDSPWIAKAISQLKSTIEIFSENHDLDVFKRKRAFASNRKYPGYSYQLQDEMDDFRRVTKVRLIIEATQILI